MTLAANQDIASGVDYVERRWTGVNQSYTMSATNQNPDSKNSYTEEFTTKGAPINKRFEGDVEIDYKTYSPYGGYFYSTGGWVYATGTID